MKLKGLLLTAATACSLSMGLPTVWAADGLQRSSVPSRQTAVTMDVATDNEHADPRELEVRSSVQVTRDALRSAYIASRTAYTDQLKKYAKCSQGDASKAISTAHPGMKVSHVQLRNIRTSLVYVGVAEDDEDRYLCIVDAGNAKLLLDKPLPTHHERVFADSK